MMPTEQHVPELARVSSKGQFVIPNMIRRSLNIREGDIFATMTTRGGLIVLKKVENRMLKEELELLKDIEEGWAEVEKGKSRTLSREAFLKELKTW